MKNLIKRLIFVSLFILSSISIFACEIEFEITSNKKETYKAGDELVVKLKVTLIHRNCDIKIKDSDMKQESVKILSATDWKEVSPGIWERKLKIQVLENNTNKAVLSATRTCNKDGGFGSITFITTK